MGAALPPLAKVPFQFACQDGKCLQMICVWLKDHTSLHCSTAGASSVVSALYWQKFWIRRPCKQPAAYVFGVSMLDKVGSNARCSVFKCLDASCLIRTSSMSSRCTMMKLASAVPGLTDFCFTMFNAGRWCLSLSWHCSKLLDVACIGEKCSTLFGIRLRS